MIQAVTIALILLSVTMSGCIFEEDHGPILNMISFSISIRVGGTTELILPLPVFQPLFEKISVWEGECEYQRVETPYGDGLWVRLDTFAHIACEWHEGTDNQTTQMSVNLTTMVPLEQEVDPPSRPKRWIPDREFWLKWSSGPLADMSIHISMVVHSTQYTYFIHLYAGELENEWNKIFVEGETQGVFAP